MEQMGMVAVVLGIAFVLVWFFAFGTSRTNTHEDELIRKCFGDREMAERLINLELKRNPGLTRGAATKYAIQSLIRDNR